MDATVDFTPEQLALQAHIRADNARFEKQCRDAGASFYTQLVDDPAHWAAMGITTIVQWEASMLRSEFSDTFKDRNGIRPDLSRYSEQEMREYLSRG